MFTTLVPFLPGYGIRVTVSDDTYVPAELTPINWEHRAYRVTITYRGRTMHVPWRAGMLIPAGDVDPREVLHTIARHARDSDQGYFEFCDEFGYDPAAVESVELFKACESLFERISRVFRGDARHFYDTVTPWEF